MKSYKQKQNTKGSETLRAVKLLQKAIWGICGSSDSADVFYNLRLAKEFCEEIAILKINELKLVE